MPKDRFHEYLDYCEKKELVSPGDFIEMVIKDRTTLAWTRLMCDLIDTYKAGKLQKVKTTNGGAAYIRSAVNTK